MRSLKLSFLTAGRLCRAYGFEIFWGINGVIYALAYSFNLAPKTVMLLFQGLMGMGAVGMGLHLISHTIRSSGGLIALILLGAYFYAQGPFLEFPSDPWVHVLRTQAYFQMDSLSESMVPLRWIYLWNASGIDLLGLAHQRTGLRVISVFWLLMLAYQIYQYAFQTLSSRAMAFCQVLGFFLLFGSDLFGISYYALSSTMIAMVCFWKGLRILDQSKTSLFYPPRWGGGLSLVTLLGVAAFNHFQEAGFMVLAIAFYQISFKGLTSPLPGFQKKRFLQWLLWAVVGLGVGLLCVRFFPHLYAKIGMERVSPWGSYRFWAHRIPSTYGVAGALSLLSAMVLFQKHRFWAYLTLFPFLCILYPPLTLVVSQVSYLDSFYRIIYLFPPSWMLVLGLDELLKKRLVSYPLLLSRFSMKIRNGVKTLVIVFLLGALSYSPSFPFYGRWKFLTWQAHPTLVYTQVDALAQWVIEHQPSKACKYVMEPRSKYVLYALTGKLDDTVYRLNPFPGERKFVHDQFYWGELKTDPTWCGIIYWRESEPKEEISSWVGEGSGHWSQEAQSIATVSRFNFLTDEQMQIPQSDYQREEVGPFTVLTPRAKD